MDASNTPLHVSNASGLKLKLTRHTNPAPPASNAVSNNAVSNAGDVNPPEPTNVQDANSANISNTDQPNVVNTQPSTDTADPAQDAVPTKLPRTLDYDAIENMQDRPVGRSRNPHVRRQERERRVEEFQQQQKEEAEKKEQRELRAKKRKAQSGLDSGDVAVDDVDLNVLYVPGGILPDLRPYMGRVIEVRVPARYISARNKEVHTQQLWGTDVYTDDSDVVAIMAHTGHIILRPNPNTSPTAPLGISVMLEVLPGQDRYESSIRFGYRSRSWPSKYHKCSLSFVSSAPITDPNKLMVANSNVRSSRRKDTRSRAQSKRLKAMKATRPEQTMTHHKENKKRFLHDVGIVFNSFNEPCFKYKLSLVTDRAMEPEKWTSSMLKSSTLYFEDYAKPVPNRYELGRCQKQLPDGYDCYQWSKVSFSPLNPLKASASHAKNDPKADKILFHWTPSTHTRPVPCPTKSKKVLADNLDWDEIEWGPQSVSIRKQEYQLHTYELKKNTN